MCSHGDNGFNLFTRMEGATMDPVLHGCATMTEATCRSIQHSQARLRTLAKRYNFTTPRPVAKWKQRTAVSDLATGPKTPRSTVLSLLTIS